MNRKILWIFVFALIGYESFNIITRRSLSTGLQYDKLFHAKKTEDSMLNIIKDNPKAKKIWEEYKYKTVKLNQQKELLTYLNKLAQKQNIPSIKIISTEQNLKKNLMELVVVVKINAEYSKVLNYINAIEKTPLFITIEDVTIQKESVAAKLNIQIFDSTVEEKYSLASLKVLKN